MIRLLERLANDLFLAFLLLILLFSVYVGLDNYQLISDADSTRYQTYRPTAEGDGSYASLRAQNPDVTGWITLDDTPVDYPIVQGTDNESYISTSVFGEFSLTGAIFLDARSAADFSDPVSILYGHNMRGGVMFGSLREYLDEDYFRNHRAGTLFDGRDYYRLEIFAALTADGHDGQIYAPAMEADALPDWLARVRERAVCQAEDFPTSGRVLLMSTCARGDTNARTLVAASILPGAAPMQTSHRAQRGETLRVLMHAVRGGIAWPWLLAAFVVLLALTLLYRRIRRKRRDARAQNG